MTRSTAAGRRYRRCRSSRPYRSTGRRRCCRRPPPARRSAPRPPATSSWRHRARAVHALGFLAPARIDQADHAGALADGKLLARGERAAVTAGAIVRLQPAVGVACARARRRHADLFRAATVRRRAGAAAVIAADHPRRAADGAACWTVADRPAGAVADRGTREPRAAAGRRVAGAVLCRADLARRARAGRGAGNPATATRPAVAATRAAVARRIVGAGELEVVLAIRVRRALDDRASYRASDGRDRQAGARAVAGGPAAASRSALGAGSAASPLPRRAAIEPPIGPGIRGSTEHAAAPANTSARPSHDFGFPRSRIGVRIRPGRALTMPDSAAARPRKTQPARGFRAAFIRKLTSDRRQRQPRAGSRGQRKLASAMRAFSRLASTATRSPTYSARSASQSNITNTAHAARAPC